MASMVVSSRLWFPPTGPTSTRLPCLLSLQQGEFPRAKKEGKPSARQARGVAQSLLTRLKARGDDHAKAVLRQMASLLGLEVSEKHPES
jgi:hypothetical protein